jgi:tight adherence protein C
MFLLDLINLQLTLQILVFFVATIFFIVTIRWLSTGLSPAHRRLHELHENEHTPGETYSENEFTVRWLEPVARMLLPQEDWKRSHMKARLIMAGYRTDRARNIYLTSKILLSFFPTLLIFFPLILLGYFGTNQSSAILIMAGVSLTGFFSPDIFLYHRKQKRQEAMIDSFPDILDLLVVCVEAGLSLDSAIQRVSRESVISHPELGEEMSLVNLELRAGKSRDEALHSLADRTGLNDVRALTSILIQAEHFGTSVAAALRDHSTEMRKLRIQRAKEKAAKLPVKMTFPILLFIFPAIFLVILGPAVIRIVTGLL